MTTASAQTNTELVLRLNDIAWAGFKSQAFAAAVDFGVFEALADNALDASQLAARTGMHPVGCRRLMTVLVDTQLVSFDGSAYRNTDLGHACTSRATLNLSALSGINPFYRMAEFLPKALKENGPVWQDALGISAADAFAGLYADPVRLRQFGDLMDAMSVPQGELIAEAFDFAPFECLMDIAGGPGGQSITIGHRHQHLRGVVMDLEPVCALARERIAAKGLADRFTAVPGDLLLGPYPSGADILLLGHILHDWSDETAVRILRHCASALPAGGTLLISESVLNPDFSRPHLTSIKDLIMLVCNESGARERTEAEYGALLTEAGFTIQRLIRFDAPRDLIVAVKA
jgi:hypothetical protein